MFKKKYKIKSDPKSGFNVYYKNWYWPFWVFFSQASAMDGALLWVENDKKAPLYL